MCGITGVFHFNKNKSDSKKSLEKSLERLSLRGPDNQSFIEDKNVLLGHTRLSIIDLSEAANQPMKDEEERYTLIFNGEIYNYKALRKKLRNAGVEFKTNCDTEVVLHQLIYKGEDGLLDLNGFFSLAFYDRKKKELIIARDRLGIKPLHYYYDNDRLIFASEPKAIMAYDVPKKLNSTALYQYLQFNYLPTEHHILEGFHKLKPGHLLKVNPKGVEEKPYYLLPENNGSKPFVEAKYQYWKLQLTELLRDSIEKRMMSDVPLGAFLSGGIDSSVIVALASEFTDQLHTFSIGFEDNDFYDETEYAELVAKHFNTEHTTFKLKNDDLLNHVDDVLNYLDEPFADSSAINVFILSKKTREHVTVALSGDGGDELFGGYNKYKAHLLANQHQAKSAVIQKVKPLLNFLPKSRSGFLGNKVRQAERFSGGIQLSEADRYWLWCSISSSDEVLRLLNPSIKNQINFDAYIEKKHRITNSILDARSSVLNNILTADIRTVLSGDMLTKTDRMSMANSLEVRVPFLDHRVVEFAQQLPAEAKIGEGMGKRILQEAFRRQLPEKIFNRPKKGFEVPLQQWFNKELQSRIHNEWLNPDKIQAQKIFNYDHIKQLLTKVGGNDAGDSPAKIWALIAFQHWYDRFMN